MSAYLLRHEGLFVGSSAAVNCVGAVKVARLLGPGHRVVTLLCDGGARHLSKFHSPAYLASLGLISPFQSDQDHAAFDKNFPVDNSLDWVGPPDIDHSTAYGQATALAQKRET